MKNRKSNLCGAKIAIIAILAACFLTCSGFCAVAEETPSPVLQASVQAADNGAANDPDPATQTGEAGSTAEDSETIDGIAIPREIVLGIFAAAAMGGALGGYYFTRKKK